VINSGIRRVSVRHPDYLPQSRRLSIAGGAQDTIKFALTDRASAATAPGAASPSAAVGTPQLAHTAAGTAASPTGATSAGSANNVHAAHASPHHVPWLGWALTGAFAAGATVTGVLALSSNSSLEDDRGRLDKSDSDVHSKASKVRALATVTDGLAAAALITGGISLWLTLGSSDHDEEPNSAGQKSALKAIQVGLGPGGVNLKAAF
jgi:hypothetical protein